MFTCLQMPYLGCFDSSKRVGIQQATADTDVSRAGGWCGKMANGLGHTSACAREKTLRARTSESPPKNSGGLSKPVALRPEAATEKNGPHLRQRCSHSALESAACCKMGQATRACGPWLASVGLRSRSAGQAGIHCCRGGCQLHTWFRQCWSSLRCSQGSQSGKKRQR